MSEKKGEGGNTYRDNCNRSLARSLAPHNVIRMDAGWWVVELDNNSAVE